MSYDPEGEAPAGKPLTVVPLEEEEDEDESPPPVLPNPQSPRTLQACATVGVEVQELGYRPLEEFKKAGFGENRVLPEVAFKRYRAFENTRLTKLDLVLKAREELLKPREGPGKSALIIAAENEAQDALQREIEKQAAFKRAQQKKAEKEVRQVLLLQANAAEMAEKNRIRQEKEAVRAAEIEEEVKRQREQFNKRKQEMEKLKIEDERAHNQKLREEQLIRLEQEKRRIAKEEKEKKKRAKEILAKQKQKAERQREHKMMIEAKEQQRELLAEKRLQQMAEKDLVRKEAAELAQEEVAKRNAEMREYQSLRMHSIREFQEKQILEQRQAFEKKQEAAAAKLVVIEARKEVERKLLVEKEKEKEVMRAKVFDQMKEIEETRRQSFIDIATAKADKQVKAQKRLVLKREVDREDMRLIGRAKEQQVARAQKAAAYKCTLMQQRLEESEEKQRKIKEARESMTKERKRMQRQAQIERAQMKESLEHLKTYGGKPSPQLMALLGDNMAGLTNGAPADDSDGPVAAIQDGQVSQSQSLPEISATSNGVGAGEGGSSVGVVSEAVAGGSMGLMQYEQPELAPRDVHVIRLEDLRRQQNEELLIILHQEHEKEKERELILSVIDDGEERNRVDKLFGMERANARRAIKRLTRTHAKELKAVAVRYEADAGMASGPIPIDVQAGIRVSSRQSIEASALSY